MLSHERTAALRQTTKNRHGTWARLLRNQLEGTIVHLQRDAETEEEQRDIRRLWDMLNDICMKHSRKAG